VVERRNQIGGNAYDYCDGNSILAHRYGPHILRPMSKKVWNYFLQCSEWHPYHHRVLVLVDVRKLPVLLNLNSLYDVSQPGKLLR
jgi:UDP-galactopyranose mutase